MHSPSDVAISVRSLGKSYKIQHQATSTNRTTRTSKRGFAWPWQDSNSSDKFLSETFWALQDISFDVPRGKVFGVIGRNGAGKSTLLKILSRITDPSTGQADIRGRVGSLLEVGTGFHPELSGRENIYLNGTLLGMRRREINAVFDEIVDFAEVSRFIDTPVKRYSSGMYVRLAFAVAAHLQPEVLIIDEVLAVGDISFQKKCLGKMKDVTGEGRTVLFVSHSLSTVNSICDECLLLEDGRTKLVGPTTEVTTAYFDMSQEESGSQLDLSAQPEGDEVAVLLSAKLVDQHGDSITYANLDEPFGIEISYEIMDCRQPIIPNLHFFSGGTCAFVTTPAEPSDCIVGLHRAIAWLPAGLINSGNYTVNIAASSMNPVCVHFHLQDRFSFNVIEDVHNSSRQGYAQAIPGVIRPRLAWDIEAIRA